MQILGASQKVTAMRYALILTLVATFWTSSAYAQEPRGYVEGFGGLAKLTGTKTADAAGEVGVRIAPDVMVFGNVGRLHDGRCLENHGERKADER